jgi:hypothetical protein
LKHARQSSLPDAAVPLFMHCLFEELIPEDSSILMVPCCLFVDRTLSLVLLVNCARRSRLTRSQLPQLPPCHCSRHHGSHHCDRFTRSESSRRQDHRDKCSNSSPCGQSIGDTDAVARTNKEPRGPTEPSFFVFRSQCRR